MPVLPIGQDDERNAVALVMVHPCDELKVAQLTANIHVQLALESKAGNLSRRDLEVVHESPGWESLKGEWGIAATRANLAGAVLMVLRGFNPANVREPSLRKAWHVVSWGLVNGHVVLGGGGKAFGDCKMPKTTTYVRESWKQYAPVGHLWAAQTVLYEGRCFLEDASEAFPSFLAQAEWFRQWGEGWAGPRQATGFDRAAPNTVLQERETWKVPDGYGLPAAPCTHLDKAPPWVAEALDAYQASKE